MKVRANGFFGKTKKMPAICPYCGEPMDRFDYELTGGHRECLLRKEEEDGCERLTDNARDSNSG